MTPTQNLPVIEPGDLNPRYSVKSWRDAGIYSLLVAVNLSAIEFNQPDFIHKIVNFIAANDLEPHYLELELTESMIMQDVNSAIATMNKLQSLGVKIATNDFGTGYSSLGGCFKSGWL